MFGGTLVQIVKMMILIVVVLAKFIRSWWYSPSAGCRNTSTSSSSASARTSPTISRDLVQLYSSDGSSVQPCRSLGIRICSKAASRSVYPFFKVYRCTQHTDRQTNTQTTEHTSPTTSRSSTSTWSSTGSPWATPCTTRSSTAGWTPGLSVLIPAFQ